MLGLHKGFVSVNVCKWPDDCSELDRHRNEVQKYLRNNRLIERDDFEVVHMFVTSEEIAVPARRGGCTVIGVGRPGADGWTAKLKYGFERP